MIDNVNPMPDSGVDMLLGQIVQRELPKPDTVETLSPDEKKLREQCANMESLFLHYKLQSMRKGTQSEDSLFGSGFADQTYQDMLDNELAQEAAKNGSIGLGDLLFKQFSGR